MPAEQGFAICRYLPDSKQNSAVKINWLINTLNVIPLYFIS